MELNHQINNTGQPVGRLLEGWKVPPLPRREVFEGRYCRLEPMIPEVHAEQVFDAVSADQSGACWTYLPYGPFSGAQDYLAWASRECVGADPLFFVILAGKAMRPLGLASFMRIFPASGSIELGHILYSPALQRTAAATEAIYLMLRHLFELGYRRCEWKCDALNAPSRAAAGRFGFVFEGIFRQATVVKNRNRDTAWFSMLDGEWPAREKAFRCWLEPENFDPQGKQRKRLSEFFES